MKSKTFGLDIGSNMMKVVWLSEENKALSLVSCLASPAPAKGMFSESPFDQEEMAQSIRKTVLDAKITAKAAHIAIPDNQVFTKVIDMPNLSDKELASAIYWEAEQYIPTSLATMTLDHKVLRRPEQSGETHMQVLLVAVQNALLTKYKELVEWAGFSVVSAETEILSTIRSVQAPGSTDTILVISMGDLSTSLAIIQMGTLVFTHTLPLGGIAMNRAIVSDFGFSPAQAEEYKKTYGISDATLGGKIAKAIDPILQSILSEVKKSLTFYTEKYKEKLPISQIHLCGSTTRLPGIDVFFVKNCGIETVITNPWKVHAIAGVSDAVLESGPEYAVAIGLSLKEYE